MFATCYVVLSDLTALVRAFEAVSSAFDAHVHNTTVINSTCAVGAFTSGDSAQHLK